MRSGLPEQKQVKDQILENLGEFRLLNEIVIPVLSSVAVGKGLGDDVSYIPVRNGEEYLAITCDVGPKPLIWSLGEESFWSWGWYCVACNVSDLASAGAEPLAFTSSVEAPNTMPTSAFREFFEGMAAACRELSIPNAGGNIRTAPRFACHGTAIGLVDKGRLVTRNGCQPGDVIVVIGESGLFTATYLKARSTGFTSLGEEDKNVLLRPNTQIRQMTKLRKAGFVRAASDNSDGLLGTFLNIAERSNCTIEVDLDNLYIPETVRDVAKNEGVNPLNLVFMWGDWQVVVAIPPNIVDSFKAFASREGITYSLFGRAVVGPPSVYGVCGSKSILMNIFRNENFLSSSYNVSVEDHIDYMLHAPLFANE